MTSAARLFSVGTLTLVGVVAGQGQGAAKQDRKAQEMVRVAAQTELNASKTDNGVRADQRAEGHAIKRVNPALTQPEREALFEEFLRWRENKDALGTLLPGPSSP